MRNSVRLRHMYTFGGYVTVPTGTSYTTLTGNTPNAAEAQRENVNGHRGIFKHLYIRTNATSGVSGAVTITFRKGGVNTSLAVVISAGSAAGTFSTTTGKIPVMPGDTVAFHIVNSSGSTLPAQSWIYLYS